MPLCLYVHYGPEETTLLSKVYNMNDKQTNPTGLEVYLQHNPFRKRLFTTTQRDLEGSIKNFIPRMRTHLPPDRRLK